MKNFIYLFALLLALSACKKNVLEPMSDCDPLPPEPRLGWNYIFPDTGYSAPCFNPENPDEIIYREHHFSTGEFWLCKLNLKTMKKEYILQGNFWSEPKWGKEDWIIFTLSDANIYKIHSNGTNLTQLTFIGKCFDPGWSHDYNKIYYSSYIILSDTTRPGIPPPQQQKEIGISMDLDGKFIDTLWGGWGNGMAPINDSMAASVDMVFPTTGLSLFNFKSGGYKFIYKNNSSDGVGGLGIAQITDKEFLWSSEQGLYVTNISSKLTFQLKETCNSNYYSHPTYSTQLNKIIMEHTIKIPKGDIMDGSHNIVMMNPDGTGEEEIKIP